MNLMHSVFRFFQDNFPSPELIARLFPLSILWSFLALYLAGYCKKHMNWKTGYTRKLFHFLIFISAYFYQQYFQLPGIFILGWSVTIVLAFAVFRNDGSLFYEALARESDAPHRTRYIVYSYLATFLGGVLSNLFFGNFAVFGYAVTGIADAIAEPVGTRFGKHRYPVFSLHPSKLSYRSLEGSFAVFVTAFFVLYWGASQAGFGVSVPVLTGMAVVCALTEAVSPAGMDNFMLQLVTAFLCSRCLG